MTELLLAEVQARPFLKWAGGKSQLLPALRALYPKELRAGRIHRYVEPFLGGGALFFDVMQTYQIDEAHLFDINEELILAYAVVKNDPEGLIDVLSGYRNRNLDLDAEEREAFYYQVRRRYNENRHAIDFGKFATDWVERAAQMIFLNKTCFNGLYRVNRSGAFNVPFGGYRNPVLFDEHNIRASSLLLARAALHTGSFVDSEQYVSDESFVYFDPPYRPLSKTASFTSYSRNGFGESHQLTLASLFSALSQSTQAKLMLSNSDPQCADPNDAFFDELYSEHAIHRVLANRMINSNGRGRGKVTEIVVTNYDV